MSDLERLDEALEQFDNEHALAEDVADALFVAARAYRDLLANGERRAAFWSVDSYVINQLQAGEYVVIPVKLLSDYPKEAENG